MNNKIISFVLVLILMISSACVTTLASENAVQGGFQFPELGNEYDLLKELGIITSADGEILDAEVTRGEFASLVVRSLNMANTGGGSASFSDVPESHMYFNEICALTKMGILKGTSPTTFSPDEKITVAQASCVALRMINMHWATEGSSMQQIVSVAASKGILDGLAEYNYYNPAHRADVYIILFNAIQTSLFVNTSYGEDANYTLEEDATILSEYWHLKKAYGLVTADRLAAIDGERTSAENIITVGGQNFLTATDTTINKLGKKIEFFYREEGKDKTIVYASAPDSKVVVLNAGDVDFDYLGGKYKVYVNDREVSFKIGDSYYLSYNGDPIIGSNRALMDPKFGSVTLIDNGSGNYDVVMIEEYYTMILDYYDSYSSKLFDISDSSRNVSIDEYKNLQTNCELEKLTKYNVLNVYKTPSKETLKITMSDTNLTGKVVSMSTAGELTVATEEKEIKITGDIRFNTAILETGNFYTFYFDSFGNAVYATSGSSRFGVILTYGKKEKVGNRDCYVLFKDGSKGTYELASSVKIRTENGDSSVSSKEIETSVPPHTMAMYEVNSKGQIREITLPMVLETLEEYNNPPTYPFFKLDYFINEWPLDVEGSTQYRREITGFGNWLILDKATVMQIPVEPGSSYNDENTTAYGIAKFQDDYKIVVNKNPASAKQDGEIEVYQFANDGLTPSVILIHGGPSNDDIPLSTDSLPHIITKISKAYDDISGAEATRLELMNSSGKTVSAFVKDESIIERSHLATVKFRSALPQIASDKERLAVGDVIQIAQRTSDGKIGRIALIYDSENDILAYSDLTDYDTIYRMVSGKVISATDTFMAFNTPQDRIERTTIGSASVIVISKLRDGQKEIKFTSRSDIMPGDTIAMYCRYLNNRLIFVYKD